MPSVSKKQHNFMEAVANNPSFAKKAGVPQSVGKEFAEADKGKKISGGDTTRADVQKINQPKTNHGSMALFKRGGTMATTKMGKPFMKPGMSTAKDGAKKPTPMAKTDMAGMMGMKSGGKAKKMASGGFTRSADGIASKGKTKAKQIKMSYGGKC